MPRPHANSQNGTSGRAPFRRSPTSTLATAKPAGDPVNPGVRPAGLRPFPAPFPEAR